MHVTHEDLQALLVPRKGWGVSLFMPTHRAGPDIQQDPIRCKNLLSDAERQLVEKGVRSTDAQAILRPLTERLPDQTFWRHQEEGLAVFLADGWHQVYQLPFTLPELIMVGSRFYIKPLLPMFIDGGRFHLLALSQNHIRFFSGSREELTDISVEGMPTSMAEAYQHESVEQSLQFHTRAPSAGDHRTAVFHGQGGGEDEAKTRIAHFFQQVDKHIAGWLRDERSPLFLTGVEYLFPLYKQVNTYLHLMDEGITGNPDGKSTFELHSQVWPVVHSHFAKQVEKDIARFDELKGSGKASNDLKEVALATGQGRVEILFVAQHVQQWGDINISQNRIDLNPPHPHEAHEILDFAAVQTLLKSGTVYALPQERMPGNTSSLAAIFRY